MNVERLAPAARRMAGLLVLVVGYGLLLGPSAAQDAPKKTGGSAPGKTGIPSDAKPIDEVQLFPLKNARAVEMARLLTDLFRGKSEDASPSIRFTYDDSTNTLFVRAPAATVAEIKAVISAIDARAQDDAGRPQLRVYSLRTLEPDKALEDALRLAFRGSGGNFSLDRQRKQVILSADESTLRVVEALLVRLEERIGDPPPVDVQVRVVWLVNSPNRDDQVAQPLPEDLKEVLPGLAKLGIDRPRLAAQTLVNVTPGTQFQAKGVAKLELPCQFSVTGSLRATREGAGLQVGIRATRQRERGTEEISNIQTEISAPPGHLVVLGMTPTETTTSVFVVQVLPTEARKPGARPKK